MKKHILYSLMVAISVALLIYGINVFENGSEGFGLFLIVGNFFNIALWLYILILYNITKDR